MLSGVDNDTIIDYAKGLPTHHLLQIQAPDAATSKELTPNLHTYRASVFCM